MNDQLNKEILTRLAKGQSLEGLGLGIRNGRIVLGGLVVPEPTVAKTVRMDIADVAYLKGITRMCDAAWRSLDFTGTRLPELRFTNCMIDNCVFDRCFCREWKLWGTQVTDTSFRSADLRTAVLGSVEKGKRNSFRQVDFMKADLQGSVYESAEFIGCTFKNTKLDKVDFGGSTFADCRFEGDLSEVQFYRKNLRTGQQDTFPENDMTNVDFSHARLYWTEFRGFDLDTVRFPEDDEHIVVNDYPRSLDRMLEAISGRTDIGARRLAVVLGNMRKWAGPNQRRGVLNKNDIREIAGQEGLDFVLKVIQAA